MELAINRAGACLPAILHRSSLPLLVRLAIITPPSAGSTAAVPLAAATASASGVYSRCCLLQQHPSGWLLGGFLGQPPATFQVTASANAAVHLR